MGKLTCEKCGEKYYKKDAEEAYDEAFGGEYSETYDEWFSGHCYCPECTEEQVSSYLSEVLAGCDAELIYMSSGEDEDYDFSSDGIDTSYYKDED